MATRERPIDRAGRLGDAALHRIGGEIRTARINLGISLATLGRGAGISTAEASRIERGVAPRVPFIVIARLAGGVGLDLAAKVYPGGPPIRDVAHVSLLSDFARLLHVSLRWDTEVPLPIPGDLRAWDGMIRGSGWRFGAEAETAPRDAQALVRRFQLKVRDGDVDGVVLLLRDTRTTRGFLDAGGPELQALFTVATRAALHALRHGRRPSGNAAIVVPRRPADPRSP